MSKSLKPKYSGKSSTGFWKEVWKLPKHKRDQAYSLGVVLQNVEADVLRLINILKGP